MVVVAAQVKSATASSCASLVMIVPVEVMRLSVGQGADTLLAGGRGSVVCHPCKLETKKGECVSENVSERERSFSKHRSAG